MYTLLSIIAFLSVAIIVIAVTEILSPDSEMYVRFLCGIITAISVVLLFFLYRVYVLAEAVLTTIT